VGSVDAEDLEERVARLAPGCDPSTLSLNPAEGFLFSRIDGATPWRLLREIGGLSPEEVDLCLESWVAQGVVEWVAPRPVAAPSQWPIRRAAKPRVRIRPEIDPASLDESLEIDLETQRRILEVELKLDEPYHELLGVGRGADAKQVKQAYFELSKEFHPDRYFRREIGAYRKRLDVIFKRILAAYELLSDPKVRAEVERSMDADAAATPNSDAAPRELTKLERLRVRMPFKLPALLLAERQQCGREFWQVAQHDESQQRFIEAASAARLAIAFDPFNDRYREGFGRIQGRAAEMKAAALMDQADEAAREGVRDEKYASELFRLCEEALLYRPHQPELNERAARAAIDCDSLDEALEYAERAVEHSPSVASYHVTLGMVHRARGNPGHAVRAFEKALEIDPRDREASAQTQLLRRARSRPPESVSTSRGSSEGRGSDE